MYLKALKLRNFKSFTSEVVPFRSSTEFDGDPALFPNVTLLLGDNGSGKSSILRAAALALVGDTLASSGFVPHNLVRRGERSSVATLRADAVLHGHDLGEEKPSPDVEPAELEVRVERFTRREELVIAREQRLVCARSPHAVRVRLRRVARVESGGGSGADGGDCRGSHVQGIVGAVGVT